MNCSDVDNLLYDYITGRLSEEDHRSADAHLANCEVCTGNLAIMRETLPLVDCWSPPEVSPGFAERVLESIAPRKRPLWQRIKDKIFFPMHIKLPMQAFAAAALVFLVVIVYRVSFGPEMGKITGEHHIQTRSIGPKAPILIETGDIDAAVARLKDVIKKHNGTLVTVRAMDGGIEVTLRITKDKEGDLFHDLGKLGTAQIEKEGYKDSQGNIIIMFIDADG